MSQSIREEFSVEELHRYIFDDFSGNSLQSLKHLLTPNSIIPSADLQYIDQHFLNRWGPVLVSQFQVHEDFLASDNMRYEHKPSGKALGSHAMVLVGVRGVGEHRSFLLQNWWPWKQFVHVSLGYLKACNPTLHYVKTPQPQIPAQFPACRNSFAESAMRNKADRGED